MLFYDATAREYDISDLIDYDITKYNDYELRYESALRKAIHHLEHALEIRQKAEEVLRDGVEDALATMRNAICDLDEVSNDKESDLLGHLEFAYDTFKTIEDYGFDRFFESAKSLKSHLITM